MVKVGLVFSSTFEQQRALSLFKSIVIKYSCQVSLSLSIGLLFFQRFLVFKKYLVFKNEVSFQKYLVFKNEVFFFIGGKIQLFFFSFFCRSIFFFFFFFVSSNSRLEHSQKESSTGNCSGTPIESGNCV